MAQAVAFTETHSRGMPVIPTTALAVSQVKEHHLIAKIKLQRLVKDLAEAFPTEERAKALEALHQLVREAYTPAPAVTATKAAPGRTYANAPMSELVKVSDDMRKLMEASLKPPSSTTRLNIKAASSANFIHTATLKQASGTNAAATAANAATKARHNTMPYHVNVSEEMRTLMRESLKPSSSTTSLTPPTTPSTNTTTADMSIIATADTPTASQVGLLSLPDEILVEILSPLLQHPNPMPITPRWEPLPCGTGHLDYSLLHTCVFMYDLALPLYYTLNTFAMTLSPFRMYPDTHATPDQWPHNTGQSTAVKFTRNLIFSARPYANWDDLPRCLAAFRGGAVERVVIDLRTSVLEFDAWNPEAQNSRDQLGWEIHPACKVLTGMVREALGGVRANGEEVVVEVGAGEGFRTRSGWFEEETVVEKMMEGMGRVLEDGSFGR